MLESDNRIFNFPKMFIESNHDRFNGLCLEVELKPLTSGALLQLIDNLLPDEDLNKMSKLLKSRMISVCAHTPLLIHGLCNSIQTKNINLPDIIDSAWTLMTPLTGQYNPNKCIRESFKCLTFEHQKTLISLHVFRTGQFNIEDAKHILDDPDICSTKLKIMCLKSHHFIEFHVLKSNVYEERCCRFSIHPLISNFLSEEVKTRPMDSIYNDAISSFIGLMQKKVSRYENKLETSFNYAHVFLVENEVHFKQYFRLLNMKPSIISLEIKVNKQISAVADLVLNNEKKKALIRNLKDQCLKERNGSMTCLWKIEEAEEYLDEDKISKAENAIRDIEKDLWRSCPDYHMSDVMSLLVILMHLKARLNFRKDNFQGAFEAISTTVYILSDVHFTQRTGIERVMRSYTVLHANIYNILGCVLLRQKHRDEAYHCFLEAFSLITGNNYKHRGQKTVLFISNIGSCFYQQGIIIKTNNIRSEHNEHIAKFGEALKYYQKAISLRERMNQQQFGTFAHELTKRGKVYLELNELRKAMIDFVNAFKIHYGIESYPHIYITLSLYYIAKAILLEGQGQLQRGFTDVAKESFGFASPMFVCVAECIKHSGLIGYDEEYDEIKNNHIWLLKHQSSPQLKKYEDMYKECSSSGHMSVLEKIFSTNMKTRHQDVLKKLKDTSTDELSKMFDEKTKQVLKGIEGHHEKEIAEETDRAVEDLPYHMDIIDDERLINEKDNIFFQNIITQALSEDHQRTIEEIKIKLQETSRGSNYESMNLVLHCEDKCQQDQADKGAAAERRKRKSKSYSK